jgi:hypothetical protein
MDFPAANDPRTAEPGYQAYLKARAAVLQQQALVRAQGLDASAYWTEELDILDYMIEASPLVVRKLRHHAFPITAIRPYDYRDKGDGKRQFFEARLQALRELAGDALLVTDHPALGGFGYTIDGRVYNVDTIKFFEVLIGMERGGVLSELRAKDRPIVCEVGTGWGGFAHQFKTLFPRSTYVLIDFPELFLFSATYLMTVFPEARVVFAGADGDEGPASWRDADFVFVPNTLASRVSELPLDLLVNMISFQEMTDRQVRGYAGMAAAAGCPLLYSLNRERSPFNAELVSVSDALADHYRLTEVTVLGTDYTSVMKKPPKPTRTAKGESVKRDELYYRHLVGRIDPSASTGAGRQRSATPGVSGAQGAAGRVVLGMTLYNNARHLPEALESILAQTWSDFTLVMLDDASTDDTEAIARQYEARDPRLRYLRHDTRQAMIATWREVVERARELVPDAEYFAWVSDHDRWHPRWLERLVRELDADPGAVLAYPITRRMDQTGDEVEKGPRLFDTATAVDLQDRWRRFCHDGVGSGDMIYGLMRLGALERAGIFRRVLRPDRLVVTELTLQGRIRQVPEVLWFRRQSEGTSVERQVKTLVLPGDEPRGFHTAPWLQHTRVLWREYAAATPQPLPIPRAEWVRMLVRFQVTYGWRHFRKTSASHAIGRGLNRIEWARKQVRHHYHHAVYNALVGARVVWGKSKRAGRRGVYELAMLTRRLGLRGRGEVTK